MPAPTARFKARSTRTKPKISRRFISKSFTRNRQRHEMKNQGTRELFGNAAGSRLTRSQDGCATRRVRPPDACLTSQEGFDKGQIGRDGDLWIGRGAGDEAD